MGRAGTPARAIMVRGGHLALGLLAVLAPASSTYYVIDPDTHGDQGCADMGYCAIDSVSDCAAAIDEANADLGASNDYDPYDVDYSWTPSGCSAACFSSYSGRALGAKRARARSPSPGPRRYFCSYFNSDSNSILGGDDGDYIFCRCADASAGPTARSDTMPKSSATWRTLSRPTASDSRTAAVFRDRASASVRVTSP